MEVLIPCNVYYLGMLSESLWKRKTKVFRRFSMQQNQILKKGFKTWKKLSWKCRLSYLKPRKGILLKTSTILISISLYIVVFFAVHWRMGSFYFDLIQVYEFKNLEGNRLYKENIHQIFMFIVINEPQLILVAWPLDQTIYSWYFLELEKKNIMVKTSLVSIISSLLGLKQVTLNLLSLI